MSEAQSGEIDLREVAANSFEVCLNWMYCGACHLPEDQLINLLDAAARLQLSSLLHATGDAIKERLDAANCLDAWDYATRYELTSLIEACKAEALTKFALLTPTAVDALDEERFVALLSHDDLGVEEECDVFNAMIRWAREASKLPLAVVQAVRFALLSEAFIRHTVRAEPLMRTTEAMEVLSLQFEFAYFHGPPNRRGETTWVNGLNTTVSKDGAGYRVEGGELSRWGYAYCSPLPLSRPVEWSVLMMKRAPSNNWAMLFGINEASNLPLEGRAGELAVKACLVALNGGGSLLDAEETLLTPDAGERVKCISRGAGPGVDGFSPRIEEGDRVRVRYSPLARTLEFAVNEGPFRLAFQGLPQVPMVPVVSVVCDCVAKITHPAAAN